MKIKNWFREIANGYTIRNREIIWDKPHGKGTSGRNGFGDRFWLYDMSAGYSADQRWHSTASPLCPDHNRFCSEHDVEVYHGPSYDEAKRAAQQWVNRRWPLEVYDE